YRMNCSKCHDITAVTCPTGGSPKGAPVDATEIPKVWMTQAKFDHTAHRAMACLDCHPQAVSEIKNNLTIVNEREPVNIRGIESCRECHAPKSGNRGGIRHGCTDCHSYHHNTPAFNAKPLTIEDFLNGK